MTISEQDILRTLMKLHDRIAAAAWLMPVLLVCVVIAASGCSRTEHRLKADREAYDVISERNVDPRWQATDYSIEIDPRSRYFDPHDPDCPPMPQDDPASHQYMRLVGGMKGWEHWDDNGVRADLENPAWREALAEYVEIGEDESVKLNIDSALQLAYVHSPSHQNQLETLYLSALDVTTERFRLDTQFFGGYDAGYHHDGSSRSDRLTVGADPALQAQRRFATAGELLVGFANSLVFDLTDSSANLVNSLANFSFIQPLLRGAGRDIALEQLTFVERAVAIAIRRVGLTRAALYAPVRPPAAGTTTGSIRTNRGDQSSDGAVCLAQHAEQLPERVAQLLRRAHVIGSRAWQSCRYHQPFQPNGSS